MAKTKRRPPAPKSGPAISVGDHGEPQLQGAAATTPEGAEAPGVDQVPPEVEGAALEGTVEAWTPREAQLFMQTVYNFGFVFFGVEWLCDNQDFLRSSPNVAHLLDRYLPRSTGGPAIDIISIAGDIAGSTARRVHLIKRGPRPLSEIFQREPGKPPPGAPESPVARAAPEKPPEPAPQRPQRGSGRPTVVSEPAAEGPFRFDEGTRQALENYPDGGFYADMGLGGPSPA